EVLNDVMLAIWKGAAGFDGRSRPSTWIFGIAYHKALKALSRRSPLGQMTQMSQMAHEPMYPERELAEPVDHDEPESLLVRRELASVLGQAVRALPVEQRTVVELTYFYGLPYQEI